MSLIQVSSDHFKSSNASIALFVPLQYRKRLDEEQLRQVEEAYQKRAHEFDERRNQFVTPEPDWQYEMELEQNVRVIAEMQAQLRMDIQ